MPNLLADPSPVTVAAPEVGDASVPFLEELRAKAAFMGVAGRKVADFILAHAAQVPDMPISEVASGAGVSEPTVARFAQDLGLKGYRELRIKLARVGTVNVSFVPSGVTATDSTADVAAKVLDHSIQALMAVKAQIDPHDIDRAVALLDAAHRIEIYGHGSSGIIAQDAQNKLFRLGFPVVATSDAHVHAMAAALLGPSDAVIAISRAGRSRELIETLHILAERGVPVVAVTPRDAPMADLAAVTIHVDFDDDPDVTTPMSSRLGQLAVLDVLAVSLALRRGPMISAGLQRAKAAIRAKRI
jgi:RpiR family carbohydrate utilization transcriptional regulator